MPFSLKCPDLKLINGTTFFLKFYNVHIVYSYSLRIYNI